MDSKKKSGFSNFVDKYVKGNNAIVLIVGCILILVVGKFTTTSFVSLFNLSRLARQAAIMGFLALGMTFVIAGGNGGIDLSVGTSLALGEILAISMQAEIMTTTDIYKTYYGVPTPAVLCFIICTLAGCIIGLFNGLACVLLDLSPFIVTLCMSFVTRGALLVYTSGHQFSGVRDDFKAAASTFFLGNSISSVALVFAILAAISGVVFSKGIYGRKLFAVGANRRAASIAGINTKAIQISTYVICGGLSVLGGAFLCAFNMAADPQAGADFEMDAISCVLIGGTPMSGGKGTVVGTVCGLAFTYMLRNWLKNIDINTYIQQMIVALLILAVVIIQRRQELAALKGKGGKSDE